MEFVLVQFILNMSLWQAMCEGGVARCVHLFWWVSNIGQWRTWILPVVIYINLKRVILCTQALYKIILFAQAVYEKLYV